MRRSIAIIALVFVVASCGGGGAKRKDSSGNNTVAVATGESSASTAPDVGLPAECTAAPFTVVAQRDGEQPAGSATFGVVGTAALPFPLVPDKAAALTPAQVIEEGASTDLLGYALFFGDEEFGPSDVSMFGGYAPTAAGKSRGTISIFPSTTTPIAVGDVLTAGTLDGLEMATMLNRITLDFKATPDELSAYLNSIAGSVTVLGLTATVLCLDVDLTWEYSDFGSRALGVLTVRGVFTAALAPRTLPFT